MNYNGRPVKVTTRPEPAAFGGEIVGIRYLDVEQFVIDGTFGKRPNPDAYAIVNVENLEDAAATREP